MQQKRELRERLEQKIEHATNSINSSIGFEYICWDTQHRTELLWNSYKKIWIGKNFSAVQKQKMMII